MQNSDSRWNVEGTTAHLEAMLKIQKLDSTGSLISLFYAVQRMKSSILTIDAATSINEAVEIAKSYSTPDSPKFINGVLDNIRKKHPHVPES